MSRFAAVPALILAAGRSSRFAGRHKALPEPAGPGLLREAAVRLRAAGLERLLAVTGHRGEEVAAEALSLGMQAVPNPDYAQGMFSSVLAGLEALRAQAAPPALLVLPVDAAWARPESITALLSYWDALPPAKAARSIIIPAYGGRAGHPPLIGGGRLAEITRWRGADGLRGALASFMDAGAGRLFLRGLVPPAPQAAAGVSFLELDDPGLLADIDTPEDYAQAARTFGGV